MELLLENIGPAYHLALGVEIKLSRMLAINIDLTRNMTYRGLIIESDSSLARQSGSHHGFLIVMIGGIVIGSRGIIEWQVDPRCHHGLASFQRRCPSKHFGMSWISFIQKPTISDSDNAVENTRFFNIVGAMTKAPLKIAFEGIGHALLVLVHTAGSSQCCKVIAMNDHMNTPVGMAETARRRNTLNDSKINKAFGIAAFPNSPCIPGSVHATDQATNHLTGHTELRRKTHKYIPIRNHVNVRLLDIDEGQSQALVAALLFSRPLGA